MQTTRALKTFNLNADFTVGKDKEVKEIFDGAKRRLFEVKLQNQAVLTKHKAAEPITVLCLSGSGTFRAGADLSEEQKLEAGTPIYLSGGIVGTLHHLYFSGTPTIALAFGSVFSALEIVPLLLVGHEAV